MMNDSTPPSRPDNPMAGNLELLTSSSSNDASTFIESSLTNASTPARSRPDNPMARNLAFLTSPSNNDDRGFDIPTPSPTQDLQVVVDFGLLQGKDGAFMPTPARTPNNAPKASNLASQDPYDADADTVTDPSFQSVNLTPAQRKKPSRDMMTMMMMADVHPNAMANLFDDDSTTTTVNSNQVFSPIQKCPTISTPVRRKPQFVVPVKPLFRIPALAKLRNNSRSSHVRTQRQTRTPQNSPSETAPSTDSSGRLQTQRVFRSPTKGFYPKIMDLTSPSSSRPPAGTPVVIAHEAYLPSCFDTPHHTKGRKGMELAYSPVPSIVMEPVTEQLVFSPIAAAVTTTTIVESEAVPQEWIDLYQTRPSTNDTPGPMKKWVRKVLRFRKESAAGHAEDDGVSREEMDDGVDSMSAFVDVNLSREAGNGNGTV